MTLNPKPAILRLKDGNIMTIRMYLGELHLCAVDTQNDVPSVLIHTREENTEIQMALVFKHGNNYYSPKVNDGKLQLGAADNIRNHNSYWFTKTNIAGEHYCLRSVANPRKCLAKSKRPKGKRVIPYIVLSETEFVQVTDRD